MTIAPLPVAYGPHTHVRLLNINLESSPSVAHFRLGSFSGSAPAMPYSAAEAPEGWVEAADNCTAPLPVGTTSLAQVVAAIGTELTKHA